MFDVVKVPFCIGVLVEIIDDVASSRVRWLHLGGPNAETVCGYVHMADEPQVPSVPRPFAIIQCTKCLTRVRVSANDRPLLLEAYREALDPLSRGERHVVGAVEFVAMSPVIRASAFREVAPPLVATPRRPLRLRLTLVQRE